MISECINVNCNSAKNEIENRLKSQTARSVKQIKTIRAKSKSKKRGPDLTKPIPSEVNSKDYVPNPKKSLLAYLGYSRAADQDESKRRTRLLEIISAGPLIPSDKNKGYILSFGPPNSSQRVQKMISTLTKQMSGQWWVRKDPTKHAAKLPALNKASEDILWLEAQSLKYSLSVNGQKLLENLNQKIKIRYDSKSSGLNERVIVPREVYLFMDGEYVNAFCHNHQEERKFKVDRIISFL